METTIENSLEIEIYEKMVKDVEYDINYHREKLIYAEKKLEMIKKYKP